MPNPESSKLEQVSTPAMNHKDCPQNLTILRQGKLYTGCEACLDATSQANPDNASHQRKWQQKQYRADTLQPVASQARDYIKHYGREKSLEQGFSEETIRKLS